MAPRLALVHTVPALVPVFDALCTELLPETDVRSFVDERLLAATIRAGRVTASTTGRLAAHVERAVDAGAELVLVTCSSLGPAVDEVARTSRVPVLRVDEALADRAVRIGERVGVLATLRTTLRPTTQMLERRARHAGRAVTLRPLLCEGAFEALRAGLADDHDERVREGLQWLESRVDVVVLAQASMARALASRPSGEVPVLTSPRLAVERAADRLNDVREGRR